MEIAKTASALIENKLESLINKNIDYTLKIIRNRAIKTQQNFFKYLVNQSGIIGASSTPTISGDGTYSQLPIPNWPTYSKKYLADKKHRYKVSRKKAKKSQSGYSDKFFIYSGGLKDTLSNLQSSQVFGEGTVTYIKPSGRKTNSNLGKIVVDLFPKFSKKGGTFKSSFKPQFYKDFFNIKTKTAGKKPTYLGMKLLTRNGDNREFIGPYMQWWTKVMVKRTVTKGLVK